MVYVVGWLGISMIHLLCVLRNRSLVRGSRKFGAVVVHVPDDNDQAEIEINDNNNKADDTR